MDMFQVSYYISKYIKNPDINILIPELPGYSLYKSEKSEKKCLEDSLIIYKFIHKNLKNVTEKNIYILGRSLGTGIAL